jgi:formate dehydrogenase major subunit
MNAPTKLSEVTLKTIAFKLDAQTIHAFEGETIFKAAKRHGVDIPHLCYKDGYRADGNCRACVVEIKGERTLAPSCCRSATEGMEVQAQSERAIKSQKLVLEMLLSDMPDVGYKWNDAASSSASSASGSATSGAAAASGAAAPGDTPGTLERGRNAAPGASPAAAGGLGGNKAKNTFWPLN